MSTILHVAVDTFFVGTLKGVGKIYLQTAIDCHSRYACARLYPVEFDNGGAIPASCLRGPFLVSRF